MLPMSTLFEMSSLRPKDTNLPLIVWISFKTNSKHGPRIKVSDSNYIVKNLNTSISISKTPEIKEGNIKSKDFKLISKWIILNRVILLDIWNEKINYTNGKKLLIPIV